MKVSYDWLKWYVPKIPTPEELADVFTYHLCEVEGIEKIGSGKDADTVFDVNILPNRAHDLLSHMGVGKEISSLLGIKYNDPAPAYKIPESFPTKLEIKIDTDKCRRYMGRIVRNVKVGPSPEWVVKHLEAIGQRSINNIVDAANIVMYDSGQPVHAFDLGKLAGEKIIIRQAKEGEAMTTLDDKEVKFTGKDMVIADDARVLAVAGVKGGKDSGVTEETENIVLEVANFNPTSVRKTAQSMNLFTDARKRFENDLSPELGSYAMRELSALILEMCPEAQFEEIADIYPQKQKERSVSFSAKRISEILGLEVSADEIEKILERYDFSYEKSGGTFNMKVPPLRLDLENEEDMAEEIGRILGYDKVKPRIPKISFKPRPNENYRKIRWAREKLLSEGYSEVMTYIFAEKGEVEVLESASDKKFMRTNLSDGLKASAELNQLNTPFLELDKAMVFEIGTVFGGSGEVIHVAYGDKKKITETTLEEFCAGLPAEFSAWSGRASSSGRATLGEGLKPAGCQISEGPAENSAGNPAHFKMWSLYPFISRDIAVWMPEEDDPKKLFELLKENGTELLTKKPYLFDSFSKDGRKSYAYRLVFQSYDRTLTDEEVNSVMEKITAKIGENKNWQIR